MNTIVVGFDDSPSSVSALQRAVDLARASGAQLVAACAGGEEAAGHARRAALLARAAGVAAEPRKLDGPPAEALARLADETSADLLVVGSRGEGTLRRAVHGSVSLRLVGRSHVPVLVVRRPLAV